MVLQKVIELIEQQLPVEASKITMGSRLFEDLGADSANVMMLIMDLEQEFDITVEDDALTSIQTVGDIVRYLEAHIKK